ncbi:MAG: hypothetical protein LBC98_01890 [Prevotellaceae bacterium]|jgi:MraZ protein|nr:hypothetical protein [Prevotellaceae bacterium]
MDFVGDYMAKLDDKSRLVLPSAFRSQAAGLSLEAGKFVVRRSIMGKCLDIILINEWSRQREEAQKQFDLYDEADFELWIKFISDTFELVPDEKTGRIGIPKKLLDEIGVDKEVVFVGETNKILVWSAEEYARVKNRVSQDEYKEKVKRLLRNKNIR